jgi:hypothetical protein
VLPLARARAEPSRMPGPNGTGGKGTPLTAWALTVEARDSGPTLSAVVLDRKLLAGGPSSRG